MDSREMSEWQAYFELEPFGQRREDYQFYSLMALLCNINSARNSREVKPTDFDPLFRQKPKKDSWKLIKMKMAAHRAVRAKK
jgi:hypothetical protein